MNSKSSRFTNASRTTLGLALLFFLALELNAQQVQVRLDPAQSKVNWMLGDVLHTVHGTFRLKSGQISFDPQTGNASGEFIVDATSGNSGNQMRDNKMNKEVLESKRYPEITFLAKKVLGPWTGHGASTLQVQGVFHIHGADHDMTLLMTIEANGNSVDAATSFDVPYQAWGMKNPSTLFLRVDNKVAISIAAVGQVTTTGVASAGH